MTRRAIIAPLALATLLSLWAGWIALSGRAFLPRHSSARDLPYAYAAPGVAAQPFNRAMTDPMNLILPDQVYLKRSLAQGRLPLWNHDILGGVPHAANPITATFYPPNLLVHFVDPVAFLLVSACLHVLLAGLFFQMFLASAGVRAHPAGIGAIAFALCGWMAAHLHNVPLPAVVAWIPLGLAGINWALAGRLKSGTFAIAISIAMQWLAGFPQFAVLGTLTLGVYALAGILLRLRAAGGVATRRTAGWIASAAVLGIALAWFQIHPSLDVRSRAPRQGADRAVLREEAFAPGVVLGALLPFWLGDAHEKPVTEPPMPDDPGHASRHAAARLVLGRPGAGGVRETSSINSFGERTLYAGAPIVLLAICGVLSINRRAAIALLLATLAAAAFACGALPPNPVLRLFGLNVGAPGRAILVLAMFFPAMAAFGLDRLLAPPGSVSAPEAQARRPALHAAWVVLRIFGLLLGGGALVAGLIAYLAPDAALGRAAAWLVAADAPRALGESAPRPPAEYVEGLRPVFLRLRADVIRAGLFMIATWATLEWTRRAARRDVAPGRAVRIGTLILGALVVADLGAAFLRINQPVARTGLFPTTPAIEFLRAQSATSRFARVSADATAAAGDMHALLPPNMGLFSELRDVQGYRDLVPPRTLRLLEGTSALLTTGGASGVALDRSVSPILDLFGARWLIAARPLEDAGDAFLRSGLRRAEIPGPVSRPTDPPRDILVYENPGALPLAYAARGAAVAGDDEALSSLRSGAVDPLARVLVERLPVGASTQESPESDPRSVTARFEQDAIAVDVTLATPGFLVVTEAWDPGWRATLWHGPWPEDRGRELEIVRANAAFMAVWVPAGRHTIVFRYWPAALTIGIVVASAGALALVTILAWPRRRAIPAAVPVAEPAPA